MTNVDLRDRPSPVAVARRLTMSRWLRAVAAIAVLVGAGGALWVLPQLRALSSGATPTASLPDTFATYSQFTSTVSADPAGRAIAVYEYGDTNWGRDWQTLALGAERDSYRRLVGRGDGASAQPVLLAPDGSRVLFFHAEKGTDEFTLQDLSTGGETTLHSVEWRSNVGGTVRMLAWSADGRYVAYSVPAPPPDTGRADDSFVDGQVIAQLAILDVQRDSTVRYPAIQPVFGASFAADGTLAVQLDRTVWLGTVDGHQTGSFPLPAGADLVSAVPWSPDGTRIPVSTGQWTYGFVDPRQPAPSVSTTISGILPLGWRSPSSVVAWAPGTGAGSDALVEVSLVDGRRTVLSRFPANDRCGLLSVCADYGIQLASGLLATASVRSSDPDRGPWVPLSRAGFVGAGALMVLGGGLWVERRRRGTRSGPPPEAGA